MERVQLTIGGTCKRCKEPVPSVTVDELTYNAWQSPYGPTIQKAFPHLTPDEREFLQTRLCGKCYDEITRLMEK